MLNGICGDDDVSVFSTIPSSYCSSSTSGLVVHTAPDIQHKLEKKNMKDECKDCPWKPEIEAIGWCE